MQFFTRTLLQWHHDHPRILPWADGEKDPYRIWLSEIIMQQTRIQQGTSYYLRFVEKFPTVNHLAAAKQETVMKMWEGLGYYTRARNLHKAARHIVENLNGRFPGTYEELLDLPGVGPYSAAAISSFAFGRHHVVVDGNVKRLISRFCGIEDPVDEPATHKKIHDKALQFMNSAAPGEFNQAIMNYGALVCKPKPACDACPLSIQCHAHKYNMSAILPVKKIKKPKQDRYFHFLVVRYRGRTILEKREGNDIWNGLYTPPLMETSSTRSPSLPQMASFIEKFTGHESFELNSKSGVIKQELSHRTVHARFYEIALRHAPSKKLSGVWLRIDQIREVAKPVIVGNFFLSNHIEATGRAIFTP